MNYYFELKDYHAIKEANLKLDGITVLAGENGCGKSTISRWFYYLVNATASSDDINLSNNFKTIIPVLNDFKLLVDQLDEEQFSQQKFFFENCLEITISSFKNNDLTNARQFLQDTLKNFSSLIWNYTDPQNGVDYNKISRVYNYLFDQFDGVDNLKSYFKSLNSEIEGKLLNKGNTANSIAELANLIRWRYHENDMFPSKIILKEDNVEIVGNSKFSKPLSLTSAVYVDTPMAVTEGNSENYFWKKLVELMRKKGEVVSAPAKLILSRIKSILGGKVDYMNDAFISDFVFHREDGLDLSLSKVATGFKSFAYLYRLIANGHINKRTLLLIDEPEAHLHPQWIVEYARVLVMINKNLGAKIIVASHNPDMVSAIQSISKKQGVIDTTNFYLAERDEDSLQYIFKDLGHEIDEIFHSFNIALDRIRLYGGDHSEE